MARWDGPPFSPAIGDPSGKDILEVGMGGDRIAREVLKRGCPTLTLLDISPKTIAATRFELTNFANIKNAMEMQRRGCVSMIFS